MLIGILNIKSDIEKDNYNGTTYSITKADLDVVAPFLEFKDENGVTLPSYYEGQDDINYYYVIKSKINVGINKICVYDSNTDNSDRATFDEFYSLEKTNDEGKLNGVQVLFSNAQSPTESAYVTGAWTDDINNAPSQYVGSLVQYDEFLRFTASGYPFLRPINSPLNKNSFGDTWEAKVNHNEPESYWHFGFNGTSTFAGDYSDGITKGNSNNPNNVNNNYKSTGENFVFTAFRRPPAPLIERIDEIVGVSVYEDSSIVYFIRDLEKTETSSIRLTPNNILTSNKTDLKFANVSILAYADRTYTDLYWIRKRNNPIKLDTFITGVVFFTIDMYNEMFPSYPLTQEEFDEFSEFAKEDIEAVTGITDFGKLPDAMKECVRRALGYQTIFGIVTGDLKERGKSYHDWMALDGYEYRYKKFGNSINVGGINVSERSLQSLTNCGLMYRGSKGFSEFY